MKETEKKILFDNLQKINQILLPSIEPLKESDITQELEYIDFDTSIKYLMFHFKKSSINGIIHIDCCNKPFKNMSFEEFKDIPIVFYESLPCDVPDFIFYSYNGCIISQLYGRKNNNYKPVEFTNIKHLDKLVKNKILFKKNKHTFYLWDPVPVPEPNPEPEVYKFTREYTPNENKEPKEIKRPNVKMDTKILTIEKSNVPEIYNILDHNGNKLSVAHINSTECSKYTESLFKNDIKKVKSKCVYNNKFNQWTPIK